MQLYLPVAGLVVSKSSSEELGKSWREKYGSVIN